MLSVATAVVSLALVASATSEIDDTLPPQGRFRVGDERGATDVHLGVFVSGLTDFGVLPPQADDNGFRMTDGRLVLHAAVGKTFDVFAQADFVLSPPLLDIVARVRPWRHAWVRAGRMKVPFGGEALIPDALIDFNAPAKLTETLTFGRSVGVEGGTATADGGVSLRGGIFSGATDFASDNRNLLAAVRARTQAASTSYSASLSAAIFGAASLDQHVVTALTRSAFRGQRYFAGADIRAEWGDVMVSGEVIAGFFHHASGRRELSHGHQVTTAYTPVPWFSALLRWDALFRTDGVLEGQLIPSFVTFVPGVPEVQFQVDAFVPVDVPGQLRVLTSFTVLL